MYNSGLFGQVRVNRGFSGFSGFSDVTTDISGMKSALEMSESMTTNLEKMASIKGGSALDAAQALRARQNDLARQYSNVLKISPGDLAANAAYLTKLYNAIMEHNSKLDETLRIITTGQGNKVATTQSKDLALRPSSQNVSAALPSGNMGGGVINTVTSLLKTYWYVPVGAIVIGALAVAKKR
ncbi:MAG: hypothetical protein Q8L34_04385 [Candidatus Woesearchaeota archaeon]|nr:hypothetical protein [Candidatus Woesearchaeota archaeon]